MSETETKWSRIITLVLVCVMMLSLSKGTSEAPSEFPQDGSVEYAARLYE